MTEKEFNDVFNAIFKDWDIAGRGDGYYFDIRVGDPYITMEDFRFLEKFMTVYNVSARYGNMYLIVSCEIS